MVKGRVTSGVFGRPDEGSRGSIMRIAVCAILFVVLAALPAGAFADVEAPHVTTEEGPDACAMCHRAHTAPGVVARSQFGSWETTGSALILAQPSNTGDAALCLTCHGIDALGSGTNVQSDFAKLSTHSLLPHESRYEDVPDKQCSSCHDAHGSAKRDDGTPYPGLLRAFEETGTAFYSGEEYCTTCHYDARDDEGNRFDGLGIYEQTAHAALPGPALGTGITCSNCHDSHGSEIAPLILETILPPAAPATSTVEANDRSLCYACHADAQVTWLGADTYDDETTQTAHGSSTIELSVMAEYASDETTRLAGECQSCHNPMGSDDGEGEAIAKLAELEGRELCYSCHNDAEGNEDITDMASFGVYPEDIEDDPVLVVAWDPAILPAAYGGLHVHTREFGGEVPFGLEGPRRYRPDNGLTAPRTGSIAYGDIDGLGDTELLVADPAAEVLRVYRSDLLAGLSYVTHSIETTAAFVEAGDFLIDPTNRPEVAVLSVEAGGESFVRVYRWQPNGSNGTLERVGDPVPVGYDATGLASGNLGLGSPATDLVVTARSEEATDTIFVLWQADASDNTLQVDSFVAAAEGVRGPSIGPVRDGAPGIVVANAEESTQSISVYSPTGASHAEYPVYGVAGAAAWDTIVGGFSSGGATGVAVAVRNETGNSAVSVFPVTASGLGTRTDVVTGERFASSALAVGDVDGDGVEQIVVGNAGLLARAEGESVSPSVQVLTIDGTGFAAGSPRWAGGTELAGGAPAVAVAELGPVGRSRHPASAIDKAHVSTETADFERHAECVDCHNVHAATGDARDSANAPAVYGAIRGTWGLDVEADELLEPAEREYEMCFKCHAGPGWGGSARDISAEFDSASSHPVTGATAEVYCVDCHNNAGDGPQGPHVSPQAPLLGRAYIGALPSATGMLCYECHDRGVYYTGEAGSEFYDATTGVQLHEKHINDHGLGCETCHTSHGSSNEYLIRTDVDWVDSPSGGACFTLCHLGSTANAYSRAVGTLSAAAITTNHSYTPDGVTGDLTSVQSQDGSYYVVREKQGGYPVLQVDMDFTGVTAVPGSFRLHGRYDVGGVAIGHTVVVQAWNFAASPAGWDTLGQLPQSAVDMTYTYPIPGADYVSGNQVRIRVDHLSGGNDNHYLWLDRVWLQY